MRVEGLFTTVCRVVKFQEYNKPIKLWFLADVHHNAKNHSKSLFDSFLREASQKDYQHIFLSLGDSIETCSDSERFALQSIRLHDDTEDSIEGMIASDVDKYIGKIAPVIKDKCIGVIGGNHYWHFIDNTTSEQRIARGLNAPYLGDATYISLILQYRNTNYTHEVVIFAHHASSDTRLKRIGATIEADIVVGAHTHQSFVAPVPKLRLRRQGRHLDVVHHETRIIRAKSFLRSYVDGHRSYAVKAGYPPTEIGCSAAIITPKREYQEGSKETSWIDIKAVV